VKNKLNLLVAEDNPDELFFILRTLKRLEYVETLETVSDGLQVIEMFSRLMEDEKSGCLPDVLILDLRMPRKSGFDVLNWMRERKVKCPVIVHTSSDDPAEAAKAIDLGAAAIVVKEVHYNPLIGQLAGMFRRPNLKSQA
jgi:DNA-binding response OmpR family regulator